MLLFLVGYMGCGKSSIGRPLAKRLGMQFVDMDTEIERRCGMSVRDFFAAHGEQEFRRYEHEVLQELTQAENTVVATGGGVPCFFDNMEFMNRTGKTVFLNVHPDVLFRRLRVAKQQRPILQGKEDDELKAFIVQALEKRAPFYHQAQYIFNADELEDRWQIETSVQRLQQLLGL